MYLSFIVCLGGAVFEELDNENVYISLDLTPFFFLSTYSTRNYYSGGKRKGTVFNMRNHFSLNKMVIVLTTIVEIKNA